MTAYVTPYPLKSSPLFSVSCFFSSSFSLSILFLFNKQYKSFASGDHSPFEPVELLAATPSHTVALNISVAGFSSRVISHELNINFMPELNEGRARAIRDGSVLSVIRTSRSARLLVNTTSCRYFGFYRLTLIIPGEGELGDDRQCRNLLSSAINRQ